MQTGQEFQFTGLQSNCLALSLELESEIPHQIFQMLHIRGFQISVKRCKEGKRAIMTYNAVVFLPPETLIQILAQA